MTRFRTFEISDPRFETDHLRHVCVKSPALRARGDITLFVPPGDRDSIPLVILLHGVYGTHWAWAMNGGAHRTAKALLSAGEIRPMVLAMPSDGLWGDGSGYLPHSGQDFESWIVDEVPAAAAEAAPGVTEKSPLFIAGLSMGGFGALRLGAKHAGRFRGISGHSSLTDLDQLRQFVAEPFDAYEAPGEPERSVLHWLRKNRAALPPVRFDCGAQDPLVGANRELHQRLEADGIPHTYEEFPGCHTWDYWREHLADSLRFFERCLAAGTSTPRHQDTKTTKNEG